MEPATIGAPASPSSKPPPSQPPPDGNSWPQAQQLELPELVSRRTVNTNGDHSSATRSYELPEPTPEDGASPDAKRGVVRAAWRKIVSAGGVLRRVVNCLALGMMVAVLLIAMVGWPAIFIQNESIRTSVMSSLFLVGLCLVALEDVLGLNKSAVMLLLAASMWTYLAVSYSPNTSVDGEQKLHEELDRGLKEVGSVILFLLPAMGVVESIDHFDGFACVTAAIRWGMAGRRERLLPIICLLTFFLSSIIDNLTSTIVALKILRHISAADAAFRSGCGGLAVMAANAGGAWSPIGDVTTTMLWISGKISAPSTVKWLFFPSFVAGVLPLAGIWWQMRDLRHEGARAVATEEKHSLRVARENTPTSHAEPDTPDSFARSRAGGVLALVFGVLCILMVPMLKMMTGLPPYLGMLLALGLFWLATDLMGLSPSGEHCIVDEEIGSPKEHSGPPTQGVMDALHKVDLTGLLFFTGVLLSVGSLDSAGVLHRYATNLVHLCRDSPVILCSLLGVSSAFVDNVPLVEATIDMFADTPADDPLWQLTALAAGTGGSILSVGSIAGVTLMSMEGVGFLWYLRRISMWATLGFAMGIVAYQVERALFA